MLGSFTPKPARLPGFNLRPGLDSYLLHPVSMCMLYLCGRFCIIVCDYAFGSGWTRRGAGAWLTKERSFHIAFPDLSPLHPKQRELAPVREDTVSRLPVLTRLSSSVMVACFRPSEWNGHEMSALSTTCPEIIQDTVSVWHD